MPQGLKKRDTIPKGIQACVHPPEWSASCLSRLSAQSRGGWLRVAETVDEWYLPSHIHPWPRRCKDVPGTGGFSVSPREEGIACSYSPRGTPRRPHGARHTWHLGMQQEVGRKCRGRIPEGGDPRVAF